MCGARYESSERGWPEFYYIDRVEDPKERGYELLPRTNVESYLSSAPMPPGENKYKFPKARCNHEGQYLHSGPLYEYPSTDFPYHKQNYRGHLSINDESGNRYDVGHKRTITDGHIDIQGVTYQPRDSRVEHRRATEIYNIPSRSDPQYYSSYQTYPVNKPFSIISDHNSGPVRRDDYPYSSSISRDLRPLYPRTRSPPWATHSCPGSPGAFMEYRDLSHDPFSR